MRKIIFLLPLLICSLHADDWDYDSDYYVKVPFNLGLWPGISIGDMMAEETHRDVYNNGFALSLIGMRAARLKGADISGIFSIYREGVVGFQGSGIFNIVNGNVNGFQGSGILNLVNGNTIGAQAAGIFNMVNGNLKGVQGSGIFSMQNGNFKGVQGAGVFTIQNGDFRGVQSTGIFSIQNGDFIGLQVNEIFNVTNGDFSGLQASGILNILNGSFEGWQLAGIINVVRYFKSGLQIGLVNISEEHDGVPIALVTYVDDVPFGYQIWYDDMQFVNFALRSGNQDWYNQLSVGRRLESAERYHSIGAGFGRRIYLGNDFSLNIGLSAAKLLDDNFKDNNDLGYLGKFNLIFHYDLRYQGSLFFGPVINASYSKLAVENLSQNSWIDEQDGDYFYRVWPGFVVGLEL